MMVDAVRFHHAISFEAKISKRKFEGCYPVLNSWFANEAGRNFGFELETTIPHAQYQANPKAVAIHKDAKESPKQAKWSTISDEP
jgi:hypothetical protein